VTQDPTIYDDLRVIDNVRYVAALYGTSADSAADAIRSVGLDDHRTAYCGNLSGGQRTRVSLACALVSEPELLVLDEPTVGLDPEQRMRFRELIAQAGEGRTVLLSTHQTEDVAMLCHRVLVMAAGRIRFDGTP
ncbi:ATP-binding cassette domain-containing protein, partial [Streptomyces sp. DSM 42041]